MKYSLLLIIIFFFFSCTQKKSKNDLIVYPAYCGGCVSKNFSIIRTENLGGIFNIYFDSTDVFLVNEAKLNNLSFIHIDNENIPMKFGDYANLVVININGETTELKTNEVLEKGKHY